MIPKSPVKVAHKENGQFVLLTREEHMAAHGMNRRPRRLTLDTNLLSTDSLKAFKSIIDLEKEHSDNIKNKMLLSVDSTFLESMIKEREKIS